MSDDRLNMGGLHKLALHVTWALQDAEVRQALRSALQDPNNPGPGIDLTDCSAGSIASRIAAAGNKRTAGRSCNLGLGDLVLYMDPREAARWDGNTIPVVTAIPQVSRGAPRHLMGYRSPTMLVDLDASKRVAGPLLVIAADRHHSRIARASKNKGVGKAGGAP